MSNSGWNNEACLAAAKELRQSFQKSGGKNAMRNTGRDRGNRSSSSSIPMKRQESFQHTPRPAPPPPGNLNVPPPSRRNYTETLVSDTPQIPRGPIMKGSLDFLNRTDSTVQKSSDSAQEAKYLIATHTEDIAKQARSSTVPSTLASKSIATVKMNHESAAEDHNIPKPAPTHAPATPEAPKAGSNVDLLRGLTTPETIQCAVEINMGSSNMAETFFSLMSQDSDEESEDALATEAEDKAVNKPNATKFLRYTSDDLLKLRANPTTAENQKADDQATSQGETRGKTETSKESDSPKLRPQAPGFVPAAPAIREAESSNAAAHTAKPRKPTKGLTASMWANSSHR
ncbi:uncharacterized protein QYS62_003651 [Fusarium acuminatum]|uniref:Uncharacterized protein n=1 Tax=Fusarium acuminatum TaxID=5515 RepID=A0ABZ2WQL1_9HYPO